MDYFKNTYQYVWSNTEQLTQLMRYYNAAQSKVISFSTPILMCQGCTTTGGEWTNLFEMNVKTTVYRIETRKVAITSSGMYRTEDVPNTKTVFAEFDSGAQSIRNVDTETFYASNGIAYLRKIRSEYKSESTEQAGGWRNYYSRTAAIAQEQSGTNSKTISFTISAISEVEIAAGKGYRYIVECAANPINASAMMGSYTATFNGGMTIASVIPSVNYYNWSIGTYDITVVDKNNVKITAGFSHQDFSVDMGGGYFITKGVKYSCYDLLRKALLTCDAHIIDNTIAGLDEYNNLGQPQQSLRHPIILDNEWNNKLKSTQIHETIFEGKNLWEVLIQIGYYLHAIPYLEYADDGTDRFVLRFKQLGSLNKKNDTSTKITVFNSRNLSDFFTQYDSYVTNLYSPQNLVEEWVSPKTSDSSFLVSNNTAELQLKYSILELVEFDIIYQGESKSALTYVFEKSIYDILTSSDPTQVSPAKGNSLYYTLGDNKIQGLSYVAPSVNPGEFLMSLKYIMQKLFGVSPSIWTNTFTFNNLRFYVKYRTQDSARLTQFRPDLMEFMKNSSYEKYPHHEQFYGQQDKIVDSERFSANLFGRLIRVGNGVFQRQEYATAANEKESGDLIEIDGESYYVTATENEYYADAIFQKVTYSKNFNQLSNIVTIPSEPRFYEVSERSKVRREVRLVDFFMLSTQPPTENVNPRFLNNQDFIWQGFLMELLFHGNRQLPNFAWTRFQADKLRTHTNATGLILPNSEMFPSSEIEVTETNAIYPKDPSDHSDCIVPLLHFPLRDGIIFEWDMDDNFKTGDMIDASISGTGETVDGAYLSMQPLRYVDIMGRADLFRFALFYKDDWTVEQMQQLPKAVIDPPQDSFALTQGGENIAVALEKDCREAISFNYQISLLHKASEGDDDFITFPNLFGQKGDSDLKLCFLDSIQSLFDSNINISPAVVLADNASYGVFVSMTDVYVLIHEPTGWNTADENGKTMADKCKSIVFYQEDNFGRTAYIVKNVAKLANEDKLQGWYIYPVFGD